MFDEVAEIFWDKKMKVYPDNAHKSGAAVVIPLSGQELKDFDEASNHDYDCKCSKCKKWWNLVGNEDDEDIEDINDTAPAF